MKRKGATLVELVLALGISAVLLLGMSSALLVAVRTVPEPDGPAEAERRAVLAADRLASDVAVALVVTQNAPGDVTLALPDVDGDGIPESVRWWRQDAPAAPLLRSVNGGAAQAISAALAGFTVEVEAVLRSSLHPGVPERGPEEELAFFENDGEEQTVRDAVWYAVPLLPTLPAGAVAWEPTSLTLRLQHIHSTGVMDLGLRRWAGDRPIGPVLAGVQLGRDDMGHGMKWKTIPFAAAGGTLRVPAGVNLVATLQTSGVASEDAAIFELGEVEANFADGLFASADQGSAWARRSNKRAMHRLRGHAWTPGAAWTRTRSTLGPVTLRLAVSAAREVVTVATPAAGLPAGGWRRRTDFAADPKKLDLDADGVDDFSPGLPPGRMRDGVFAVPSAKGFSLGGSAAGLPGATRVRLRLRDQTPGDAGGGVEVRFGRVGATARRVAVRVIRDEEGQRLKVSSPGTGPGSGGWYTARAAEGDWVDVVLVLDPEGSRAAVEVDGAPLGSVPVEASAVDGADFFFLSVASGVEVDELDVTGGAP